MVTKLPLSLLDSKGQPKRPPARTAKVFQCRACGSELDRSENFWVCPKCADSKLKSDGAMLRELAKRKRPGDKWKPQDVLRIQLRVRRRLRVRLPQREREREREVSFKVTA